MYPSPVDFAQYAVASTEELVSLLRCRACTLGAAKVNDTVARRGAQSKSIRPDSGGTDCAIAHVHAHAVRREGHDVAVAQCYCSILPWQEFQEGGDAKVASRSQHLLHKAFGANDGNLAFL
jgi:hypothetical protein